MHLFVDADVQIIATKACLIYLNSLMELMKLYLFKSLRVLFSFSEEQVDNGYSLQPKMQQKTNQQNFRS